MAAINPDSQDDGSTIMPCQYKGPQDSEMRAQWYAKMERTATEGLKALLYFIGEDPDREGLEETPARVLRALKEMTQGSWEDPKEILSKQFDSEHDELVILRAIPFTSLCEHHVLPFTGTASVAYIPKPGKVVGLSKLGRLVQCFTKRLQIQERMTNQIADALVENLQPLGAACIIRAAHSCMSCRGAKLTGTEFITSAIRGVFRDDPSARAELMALIRE